jgi:glycosyltransferase involved in cell wall biosynthesis
MALAAGLPMVTTINSGSVLRDGVEGFLVPPRDTQALADRILELFTHPEVQRRMGVAARETVRRHYTWAHYRLRVASAYRGMLQGPNSPIDIDPPLPV